jgi:tripartite-type tricarboxylate transporter receptor subunit TctC
MRAIQASLFAFVISLAGALVAWATSSQAEPWPQRTVRVIVPLPPGAATDLAARLFAEKLAARWRQPVVIENRQGADGIPAVSGFVNARDDHTLLCSFAGIITINPLTYEKLPYDPIRDLVPVASIAENFVGIAVSAMLKVKSLDDFVKAARAQPNQLSWAATPGVPLYALAALQNSTGVEMVQVSYRDFTPALQDVGEGRIHVIATGLALMLPQVQVGKIRLLMLNSRQRSPQAPETPTASETGHPELTFDSVVGFYGWRDIGTELKERIAADVRAVTTDPVIAARLTNSGSALRVGTPAEFAAAIEQQRAQIAAIARTMKPTKPTH